MSNKEKIIIELVEQILDIDINCDVYANLINVGMDSIKVIQLLVKLEEEFNIEFADEDLQMKFFVSIKEIAKLVDKKLNEREFK